MASYGSDPGACALFGEMEIHVNAGGAEMLTRCAGSRGKKAVVLCRAVKAGSRNRMIKTQT